MRLRALRQVQVASGNLTRGARDVLRAAAHVAHDSDQAGIHVFQRLQQLAHLIAGFDADIAAQVASSHLARHLDGVPQGPHDAAADEPGRDQAQHAADQAQHDDQHAGIVRTGHGRLGRRTHLRRLRGDLLVDVAQGGLFLRAVARGLQLRYACIALVHAAVDFPAHRGKLPCADADDHGQQQRCQQEPCCQAYTDAYV